MFSRTIAYITMLTMIAGFLVLTSHVYGVNTMQPDRPFPALPNHRLYHQRIYEYNVDSYDTVVTLADARCTIIVEDPMFHTTTVDGVASQSCTGVASQNLVVCVQVLKSIWFYSYWADLDCKGETDSPTSAFTSVSTNRISYVYGTQTYRVAARGSFTAVDGRTGASPLVPSLNEIKYTFYGP